MLTEIQDRDAIVNAAIAIPSAEGRQAYIAGACGKDTELRQQVEKMVAAHFHAPGEVHPSHAAVNGASASRRTPEKVAAGPAENSERPPRMGALRQAAREHPRLVTALVVLQLFLLVSAAGGSVLAVWAMHVEGEASRTAEEAVAERDQAQKDTAQAKQQRDEAETARQTLAKEREDAIAETKATNASAEDAKAVLAFFNDKVLSLARPKGLTGGPEGWPGGLGKNVTLRQAVDASEPHVAEMFADRPLAEAAVRETLGTAYVNLAEAALAVKQYERAFGLREALQGEGHPETVACRNKLAVAYRLAGRTDDASRLYDQPFESSSHAAALAVRAAVLLSQNKPDEAELKLRKCLAIREKLQPNDWTTFETKLLLGEALLAQKKDAAAEPLLRSAYEGMKQRQAQIPAQNKHRLTTALEHLVRLHENWGNKEKAAQWRKELEAAKASKQT
jgi:tetratricopeptide (TPR) repeat protein